MFFDADKICAKAFEKGLIIETSGSEGEVVKFLGSLIIDEKGIHEGFNILEEAIEEIVRN